MLDSFVINDTDDDAEVVDPLTGFLYAEPSFLEGAARILDFGATFTEYNTSPTEADADTQAILSDWVVIGNDIRRAIGLYERADRDRSRK